MIGEKPKGPSLTSMWSNLHSQEGSMEYFSSKCSSMHCLGAAGDEKKIIVLFSCLKNKQTKNSKPQKTKKLSMFEINYIFFLYIYHWFTHLFTEKCVIFFSKIKGDIYDVK